jgi:membrane-associated phospholipid phosphatase
MDNSLFRWINRLAHRTGWAHGFFTSYAKYGIVLFAVLLVAAYLDGRQHDDLRAVAGSVWSAGAALVALGIGQLIGGAIDRARPYEALTGVRLLVDKTTDFSFPSDHATAAGAVAVGLLLTNRRWGIVAAVLAVVMAFTRVYVGAHYPGDVIAGLALGGAVAAAGTALVVPLLTRIAERLSRTRFRVLLISQTGQTNGA